MSMHPGSTTTGPRRKVKLSSSRPTTCTLVTSPTKPLCGLSTCRRSTTGRTKMLSSASKSSATTTSTSTPTATQTPSNSGTCPEVALACNRFSGSKRRHLRLSWSFGWARKSPFVVCVLYVLCVRPRFSVSVTPFFIFYLDRFEITTNVISGFLY